MNHTPLCPSPTTPSSVHVCLDEGKNLSESLAHHLKGQSQSLAVAFQEWIDFALETDHASVMQLPLLCLSYDHLCIIRRGGRVFVIYAHPYHNRAHVAQMICHLNDQIHRGPHALVLKNSACENRIRSIFDPSTSLAEAA
jgi:hypothetical protein